MSLQPPRTIRKHFASSLKVALVATMVVVVVYAGAVAVLDALVAHRLVEQVDRQLAGRLAAARTRPPARATEEPDSPGGGVDYGLGIYGEPIYVWEIPRGSSLALEQAATPELPSMSWPNGSSESSSCGSASPTGIRGPWKRSAGSSG